ncbi:MATE family efflux transporter [Paenibacillus popilliae]|uniref:Probable multidrug resistance protein NorM n=1 Tax=Paenibacillus popilliae ATCC 14706 TaxID=1212764 RepID=M9LS36_PAEPP|nr:MATE family efflux transporter [Paenibacillus popilliae]GAC44501.1 Na+-driven multidrug efflux pump [Paenibacillus popilliae ATCC 14706]
MKSFKETSYYQILILSLPIFISSTTSIFLGVTDTLMIGRTNVQQLAGVSGGAAIFSLFSSIIVASLTSNEVLAAKYFGENNVKKVKETLLYTLIFGLIISLSSILLMAIFAKPIFRLIVGNPDITNITLSYLLARSPELFFLVPFTLLKNTLNANKRTKWAMYSSFTVNLTNIFFGYFFIFGIGPIPRFEAVGAGISSSLATLSGLILLMIAFKKEKILQISSLIQVHFSIRAFLRSQKLSYPPMGSAIFDYVANLVVFGIMGTLGSVYLAGGRIAFQLDMIIFIIAMGLGIGGKILIGRFWGKKDINEVYKYFKSTLIIVLLGTMVISLPFILIPEYILFTFTTFNEVVEVTKNSILLIGISAPIIGGACVLASVLRALGKTNYDMYANVLPIWIFQIPVSILSGLYTDWGLTGIYLGFLLYWVGRCIMSALFVKRTLCILKKDLEIERIQANVRLQ